MNEGSSTKHHGASYPTHARVRGAGLEGMKMNTGEERASKHRRGRARLWSQTALAQTPAFPAVDGMPLKRSPIRFPS